MDIMTYALATVGGLAVISYFSPTVRTWVLIKLGVTTQNLTSIIGDLEKKITLLEAHAEDLTAQAVENKLDASDILAKANAEAATLTAKATAAEADATRAVTIAGNVKALIAA